MTALAVALAATAALLVWPTPALLAGSPAALRHPAAALVVWQAVGLLTGVAAIGAAVTVGLHPAVPPPLRTAALLAAAAAAAYLLTVAGWTAARTVHRRRRHRTLLDLVGTPLPQLPGGRLLDSDTAMAYCLPGLRPRLVLTSATLTGLTPPALAAVVAHESAHLSQRHDLVVLPFVAWHAALPFLPGAGTARAAVALLLEALADDAARARVGAGPLREALHLVALHGVGADGPGGAPGPATALRLARLGPAR